MNEKATKPLIFICNSETDGFREGDGDLMDKLMISINQREKMNAVRIIMYEQDIPQDRLECFAKGEIVALEKKRTSSKERKNYRVKDYQNKFFQIIQSTKYQGRQKILYIGSRLDYGIKKYTLTEDELSKNLEIFKMKKNGLAKLSEINENEIAVEEFVLKQSGALFDNEFIKNLKEFGVKIIICCLEYKFLMRSKNCVKSGF